MHILNKKMKRGYFFVLDAMLGLLVLVIGVFLVSSSYVNAPQPTQVGLLSDDLLNFLSNTKIQNLNNPYAGIGGELWNSGKIKKSDNSLLQQAGEFYQNKDYATAEKFIQNVSIGVIPTQFRYEVWMNSVILYPKTPSSEHIASRNNTKLLLTSKKIIFGINGSSSSEIWGPYKAEVFVWEK